VLPNFFIVGAQKSATTSLYNYLSGHPDVYLPAQKEAHFFNRDDRYAKGLESYEREYFAEWSGEKAVGEVTPDYMYFENTLPRMARHLDLKEIRFIFILRNPVQRAYSHYLMTYRRGLEPLSFEEAIDRESDRLAGDYASRVHFSYVSRGFYFTQIRRYFDYVDQNRLLVLLTEDLNTDAMSVLGEIFAFLEISTAYVPQNLHTQFHRGTSPRSAALLRRITGGDTLEKHIMRLLIPNAGMRARIRQKILELNQTDRHDMRLTKGAQEYLTDIYAEENRLLAELLGRDLSAWSNPTRT